MSQTGSFEEWFEEMATLARKDPDLFEEKRRQLIEQTIEGAAPENRLRLKQLQWRIDRERERAKTPLAAAIRLHDMLMEMVYGEGGFLEAVETLRDLLKDIQQGKAPRPKPLKKGGPQAKVIPFPRRV